MFDYSEDAVEARLSVFASVRSDLDLAAQIRLINEDANLQWSCQHLTKFSDSSNTDWVGYSAFVAPEGAPIPKGKYVLIYEDSCEREGELVFTVDYPDALLEKLPASTQGAPSLRSGGATNTSAVAAGGTTGEEPTLASSGAASTTAVAHSPSAGESYTQASDGSASTVALDEAAQADAGAPPAGDHDGASGAVGQGDQSELAVRHKRNDGFKHLAVDEVRGILGDGAQAKIALYSSERTLLYFGDDEDGLIARYKDAAFSKVCLCTQDDAIICVFGESPVQH